MIDFDCGRYHDINDYIKLIAILRGEDGCPWDRVQTHGLRPGIYRLHGIGRAQPHRHGGESMASSTWLRPPFLQAELLDTYMPLDSRKFISTSLRQPGRERLSMWGAPPPMNTASGSAAAMLSLA